MGLRRIEEKLTQEVEMKRKGAKLALESLEVMSKKVKNLHKELEKLEQKYKNDFKKNPDLSKKLMAIRKELGLPEALGIFEISKKSRLTGRLKNKEEYHNYLALRILEIGKADREKTGGMLSLSEIAIRLNDESRGITTSITDMTKALDLLERNGMIHKVREISGVKVVEFVDSKLSKDHERILELAAQYNGQIGLSELLRHTSWTIERLNRALDSLIKQRIAYKSDTIDGVVISFPAL
ncbi:MAG: EAP30/Vps36 family vacuolar-sorting protein [Candidatus Hodarchaeales archaeon]